MNAMGSALPFPSIIERWLPVWLSSAINLAMERAENRPTKEEVTQYCLKNCERPLFRFAAHLPEEQREEIRQSAILRVLEAYPDIKPEGWKAFVQQHCRGAVLDYLRCGDGFEESVLQAKEAKNNRLVFRMSLSSEDNESLDVEEVAAILAPPDDQTENRRVTIQPDWDLIARLAAMDMDVHLVAKTVLLSFTQEELSDIYDQRRERLSQRVHEFFREHKKEYKASRWSRQIIHAFDLWEVFDIPVEKRCDQGIGWDREPVDIFTRDSVAEPDGYQPKLIEVTRVKLKRERRTESTWSAPKADDGQMSFI